MPRDLSEIVVGSKFRLDGYLEHKEAADTQTISISIEQPESGVYLYSTTDHHVDEYGRVASDSSKRLLARKGSIYLLPSTPNATDGAILATAPPVRLFEMAAQTFRYVATAISCGTAQIKEANRNFELTVDATNHARVSGFWTRSNFDLAPFLDRLDLLPTGSPLVVPDTVAKPRSA